MTQPEVASLRSPVRSPSWTHKFIGIALIAAGLFVLGNVVAATLVTVKLFGATLVVVGVFEAASSFWTKGWARFTLNMIVGALYVIAGAVLLSDPLAATVLLTLIFAVSLIVSGFVRVVLAFRNWQDFGWLLLASGIIAIFAGAVIWSGWPVSGLWVFGVVLGIDLLTYGAWWLAFAFAPRATEYVPQYR